MRKVLVLFFVIFVIKVKIYGQIDDLSRQRNIFIQDEYSFGFFLKTNGIYLDFRRGYFINLKNKNLWELGFSTIKHPKEFKQDSYYVLFASYVYGKLNEVYCFNTGIGRQFVIVDKREPGTLQIIYLFTIGIQTAILKPIYYEIITSINPYLTTDYEKYKPAHQPGLIYQKAPWYMGLNEITFNHGFYAQTLLSFEHSKSLKSINSLEIGARIDFFIKPLEIMAETENFRFNPSFLIGYRFGKLIKTTSKKPKQNI